MTRWSVGPPDYRSEEGERHGDTLVEHAPPSVARPGHTLRHSAAAALISAGASPKALQGMLGHSSAGFSLTRYGHLFDADLDALATRLDDARRECEMPVPVRRIGSGTWTTVSTGF
jgi:hypothetical protein